MSENKKEINLIDSAMSESGFGSMTVSYTHLDVYKRQKYYRI